MGGVCSSKQDQTTPQGSQMLYSNDPLVNSHEKSLIIADSRYSNLVAKYQVCIHIADDPDNKVQITTNLKEQLQKLSGQKNQVELSQKMSHEKLNKLKNSASNAQTFGLLQKEVYASIKGFEEGLSHFETAISGLKEEWQKNLVVESLRSSISEKLGSKIEKTKALADVVSEKIEAEKQEIDYFEGMIQIYQNNEEIKKQYETILQNLNSLIANHSSKLEEAKSNLNKDRLSLQDYELQSQDPMTKSGDFEIISELASNISAIKESLLQSSIIIDANRHLRSVYLNQTHGFGLPYLVSQFKYENSNFLSIIYTRINDNVQAYKKALQIQKSNQTDEEEIKSINDVEQEINEIIQSLGEILEDKNKLDEDAKNLQALIDDEDQKQNLGKLADILEQFNGIDGRQKKLEEELLQIEKEVEVKKVELQSGNAANMLREVLQKVEVISNQFEDNLELFDRQYDLLDVIKSQSQKRGVLATLVYEKFRLLQSQIDEDFEDTIKEQFQKVEQRINDLINFWEDQQSKGLNNADDAIHLITELESIKDSVNAIETKVFRYVNLVNTNNQRIRDVFRLVGQQIDRMADVFIQTERILGKHTRNEDQNIVDENFEDILHMHASMAKLYSFLEDDSLPEGLTTKAEKIFNGLEKLTSHFARQKEILQDFGEKSTFNLQWANATVPVVNIYGLPEQFASLKIRDQEFQAKHQDNPIEKKLLELQSENTRMTALPLAVEDGGILVIDNQIKTQAKIIEGTLCIQYGGGYLPFEDFVNTQYLEILTKNAKLRDAEAKQNLFKLQVEVQAYSE